VPPAYQSPLFIFTVYRDALTQAGWKIVHEVQSVNGADMVLSAHYSAGERDIWATLHGGGETYSVEVADVGVEDIGKELDQDCHVALYGIYFDFNKATIRADSDPVLGKVLALLQSRPTLKLEIQGHTDNVGTDDYNQKLSEARANAVSAWLIAKGISADRLSAKGYGMKMPIADNGSDEGRAKNRRVEIQKQGCTK
jgi:outer membrane protein OmpA-like peptidoglycan-associated protein